MHNNGGGLGGELGSTAAVSSPAAMNGWGSILEQLETQVADMVADFMAKVFEIPEYASSGLAREELLSTAEQTVAQLVAGLRSGARELDDALAQSAHILGGRRARAGIPPEALISAVRLDFPVMWARLLELVDTADLGELTLHVEEVWNLVDQYATRTHAGYLDERVLMAQEEAAVEKDFIAQLFSRSGLAQETLQRIGDALHLEPAAPLVLVAARGAHAAVIRTLEGRRLTRYRVHIYESGGVVYGFWKAPSQGSPWPPELSRTPCALLSPVPGLGAIREAALGAEVLAAVTRDNDGEPLQMELGWPRVALDLLEQAHLPLRTWVESSLQGCRESEQERLKETARSFLSTGKVSATAQALYCHRNTVLNRMARFYEVTGIDLTVPEQAARLVVAWS